MTFEDRHIGSTASEQAEMLKAIGTPDIDTLIGAIVPEHIRLSRPMQLPPAMSEQDYLTHLRAIASKNKLYKNFIGQGYYGTFVPPVNLRNIFENPGWYTAYTPYQAEIAQGRLEALLNFQTMVVELTSMELANASLLDEATAAAEAMILLFNSRTKAQKKAAATTLFMAEGCYPQTIEVVKNRAENIGVTVEVGTMDDFQPSEDYFGAIVQFPDQYGNVASSLESWIATAQSADIKVGVAADIMALVLLKGPGQWNADIVFGNTQRFGVPMGFGGPHAAYFATKEAYKRSLPGRIIGVSKDADGKRALRMALQTREQHIKRDKATSNICTAQALLAVMSGMYAVYHGPKGLRAIASEIHQKAGLVAQKLKAMGWKLLHEMYFDTLHIGYPEGVDQTALATAAEKASVNLHYFDHSLALSLDETHTADDLSALLNVFAKLVDHPPVAVSSGEWKTVDSPLGEAVIRTDDILPQAVFNTYHSETKMMRYQKHLENKDLSLVHSMIPLGSCTMKLNAAVELMPLSWAEFAHMHPFAPQSQWAGYRQLLDELARDLCEITGFAGVSLQPNSGAQGEYTGLMVIKAYHRSRGEAHRNICLIPSSAHGTNPASAVMAGMKVVVVAYDDEGNVDVADLKAKAEEHRDHLAALMITYPSTHGVYESAVTEITAIVHENGGQVYMDGANMNAQVGLTHPGNIGADVCHLNLHKTFAIPHGGGGPGMGPIGVAQHLVPFLPGTPHFEGMGGSKAIRAVSATPYGSGLIALISYGYIKMLGAEGLKRATENAILNANYLKVKLEQHFPILYKGRQGMVAHEMIVDCRGFKKTAGVDVTDIAKRLIDYGFHAPTVSFPVAGTIMIEPTESEDKEELDRFIDALIGIRKEIDQIAEKGLDQHNNLLKNAPHSAALVAADEWRFPYSRQQAAWPTTNLSENKYWSPVRRVDNAYGDRNLICSCPPVESYLPETA